jgi:fucose 4-O-acetylase-like acetyltransferase
MYPCARKIGRAFVTGIIDQRRGTCGKHGEREPRWDNLRYLAGSLVILIHAAESLGDRAGLHWLYLATWAMRVPLFALLAGYFSNASPPTGRGLRRLAGALLVPCLVLQLLACVQIGIMSGGERYWTQEVHGPAWTLWFLQALFLWRVALPHLARLRHPLALSVVVSLLAGFLPLDPLPFAFSRAVGLLPFFLLGWTLRRGGIGNRLWSRRGRHAALAVLAVTAVTAWLLRNRVDRDLLLFRQTYGEAGLPLDAPWAWTIRCAALLGGMAIALSVIRLVPGRRLAFVTYLGSGGLYIYLLNPFLLRPLNAADAFAWVDSPAEQAGLAGLALAVSAVLAAPPVRRLARPLVRPKLPAAATGWWARAGGRDPRAVRRQPERLPGR